MRYASCCRGASGGRPGPRRAPAATPRSLPLAGTRRPGRWTRSRRGPTRRRGGRPSRTRAMGEHRDERVGRGQLAERRVALLLELEPRLPEVLCDTEADVVGRRCSEGVALKRELPRAVDVVRVEKGDQLSTCLEDPAVTGAVGPPALLCDHAHGVAEAPSELGAAVGRAVVDDDDLELGVALPENRFDRLREVQLAVVHRDDARDQRHGPEANRRGGRPPRRP